MKPTHNKIVIALVSAALAGISGNAFAGEVSSSVPAAHQASNSCCHTAKTKKKSSSAAKSAQHKNNTTNSN